MIARSFDCLLVCALVCLVFCMSICLCLYVSFVCLVLWALFVPVRVNFVRICMLSRVSASASSSAFACVLVWLSGRLVGQLFVCCIFVFMHVCRYTCMFV